MKIEIAEPAERDLDEIKNYICQDNPPAAYRMIKRIFDMIDYLAEQPHMGRTGRVPHTKEFIISSSPFIIIYQVRQQTLFILRILHSARKWPAM